MGLIADLLASVPSAPGSGLGAGTAGAGTGSAGVGGGPPTCSMPGGDAGDGGGGVGGDGNAPTDVGGGDEPESDFTDGPEPMTNAYPPLSWDNVFDGPGPGPDAGSPSTGGTGGGGDSFFYPEDSGRSYLSVKLLEKYGDWVNDSDSGFEKAAKLLPGVVIIPLGAMATCAEHTLRSPGL